LVLFLGDALGASAQPNALFGGGILGLQTGAIDAQEQPLLY